MSADSSAVMAARLYQSGALDNDDVIEALTALGYFPRE
jgi:hypothetical protein